MEMEPSPNSLCFLVRLEKFKIKISQVMLRNLRFQNVAPRPAQGLNPAFGSAKCQDDAFQVDSDFGWLRFPVGSLPRS